MNPHMIAWIGIRLGCHCGVCETGTGGLEAIEATSTTTAFQSINATYDPGTKCTISE
jgi:hypothetical protein